MIGIIPNLRPATRLDRDSDSFSSWLQPYWLQPELPGRGKECTGSIGDIFWFSRLCQASRWSSAATPPVGVATTTGNLIVDSIETPGNATIFDGNVVQTRTASSQVRLKDGAQVRFGTESRGKIFSDHVDLLQGSAQVSGYAAVANGLSIRPEGAGAASVSIQGKTVEVAALTTNVHVFNAQGINVANLVPGRALNLAPQDAGASPPSSLTGCAVRQGTIFS